MDLIGSSSCSARSKLRICIDFGVFSLCVEGINHSLRLQAVRLEAPKSQCRQGRQEKRGSSSIRKHDKNLGKTMWLVYVRLLWWIASKEDTTGRLPREIRNGTRYFLLSNSMLTRSNRKIRPRRRSFRWSWNSIWLVTMYWRTGMKKPTVSTKHEMVAVTKIKENLLHCRRGCTWPGMH